MNSSPFNSRPLGNKADKVSAATAGNLAGLDAVGNLTDSGIVAGKITRVVKAVTGSLSATECHGTLVTNKAQANDVMVSLPPLAEGLNFVFVAETTVAKYFRFYPDASEIIRLDSTALTGGYYVGVVSVAEGNKIAFMAVYNNAGALIWDAVSLSGAWLAQS